MIGDPRIAVIYVRSWTPHRLKISKMRAKLSSYYPARLPLTATWQRNGQPRRQGTSQSCAQFWNLHPGPRYLPRRAPALVKHPVDEPAHLSGLPTGA